mgnify:FL=1
MARVLVDPAANWEARLIDRGWRRFHPARPRTFAEEWNQAKRLLRRTPQIGEVCPRSHLPLLRRWLLEESQHWLSYIYDPSIDEVVVLLPWSTSRDEPPLD